MTPQWRLKTPYGEGEATKWREVGAGWDNPDGSINIILGACVTLTNDRTYILFRADVYPKKKKASK